MLNKSISKYPKQFSKTWISYLLVYFHQILELDSTTAGYLLLAGQITDGLATPIVGIESDRFGIFGRFYGRRKSWHGFGSICVILSFVFIFTVKVFEKSIEPPRERTSSAVHFHMDRWTVRVRVRLFSASSSNIKRAPIVQPTNHARLCCNGLLHSFYCNFSNWMGINTSFTSFNHSKPDLQRKRTY